jgi:hypothetical protein
VFGYRSYQAEAQTGTGIPIYFFTAGHDPSPRPEPLPSQAVASRLWLPGEAILLNNGFDGKMGGWQATTARDFLAPFLCKTPAAVSGLTRPQIPRAY